jgi:hypothetical protein
MAMENSKDPAFVIKGLRALAEVYARGANNDNSILLAAADMLEELTKANDGNDSGSGGIVRCPGCRSDAVELWWCDGSALAPEHQKGECLNCGHEWVECAK